MADALITRLSRIKEIAVRPTTSITRYLDATQSPGELGRELRADVVLCGSVRRSAAQVRVTVQLIDVATEAALWADKFDEAPADIFAIEDSISERVADALAPELTGQERRSLTRRATQNAEAYDLYLRGRFWLSRRTGESIRKAVECFERAVLLDPQYALAHASIAEAYAFLSIASATIEAMPPREVVPLALAAAQRALAHRRQAERGARRAGTRGTQFRLGLARCRSASAACDQPQAEQPARAPVLLDGTRQPRPDWRRRSPS